MTKKQKQLIQKEPGPHSLFERFQAFDSFQEIPAQTCALSHFYGFWNID